MTRHFRSQGAAPNGRALLYFFICLLFLPLVSCKKQQASSSASQTQNGSDSPNIPQATSADPALPTPWEQILSETNGSIALAEAQAICALGPRDYLSAGHEKTRTHIITALTKLGCKITLQTFGSPTPAGPRTFTNLIAQFPPPSNSQPAAKQLLLAAHYDAPGSRTVTFPSASASAAGCGILLEIAARLAAYPALASQLLLVFLDGEEPASQTSAADGLNGSRFLLHGISTNGQLDKIRAFIAFGAVGHAGAQWTLPLFTTPKLNTRLREIAAENNWEDQITDLARPTWGSHLPAFQSGLPSTLLNDALYPAFATADDDATHLDQESLRRAVIAAVELLKSDTPKPAASK